MKKHSNKAEDGANYGIIGDVRARAVAVGTGARAVSHHTTGPIAREDFEAALRALHEQIARLSIPDAGKEELRTDVKKLEEIGQQEPPPPDRAAALLEGIVGKLKMVGLLIETAAPLRGPLKAIAAMFGVPLPF